MIFLHEMARIIFKCIIRNVSVLRAIEMGREYYVLRVSQIYFFLNELDKEKNIPLQNVEKVSNFCENINKW